MSCSGTLRACFCLSLLLLAGCGESKPPVYPVTGKVTGGSGELTGILLVLSPVDTKGLSATGTIKEGGFYELTSTDGRVGAMAGKYKVMLAFGTESAKDAMLAATKGGAKGGGPSAGGSMMQQMMKKGGMTKPSGGAVGPGAASGPPKMVRPFPDAYSSSETSPKEVEVKSGPNVLDISL